MATWSQLPGRLDLEFVIGDEVTGISLEFSEDLTNYTFETAVYSVLLASSLSGAGVVETIGDVIFEPAVTVVDASEGQVTIGMGEAQTELLSASTAYGWFFRWVSPAGVTRTVVSGSVKPFTPSQRLDNA